MAHLTVNGALLEYEERGTGGPPFIFIHGWACDRSAWAPQFADLSRDHRCISVNLRGRGGSSLTPPYDTTTAADDVAALIGDLNAGPSILIGHSLGGLVSLLVNDRHPDLVLGIVLGDSPLTGASGGFERTVARIREAGNMSPVAGFVESFFVEGTSEAIREAARAMMLSCPAEVGAGMLENDGVFVARLDDLLKSADQKPLMAIWAENPLGNPEHLRDIAMFIRQEPIAGAGHFFQLEQPDVTNALLRAFLDDVLRDPRIALPADTAR